MKRICVCLLAAALFIGLLAGCGAGGVESSTLSGGESTTTTTTGSDGSADTTTTTEGTDTTIGTAPSETGDSMTTTDTATRNTGVTQGTTVSSTAGSTSKPTSTTQKPSNGVDMDGVFAPILAKTPRVVRMTDYDPTVAEWAHIQAITYDGADLDGKKTKVFAYIGYPEGASATNKAPAVVLVHGGGGHAFAEWVKLWTDRGYVAIAMDTTGFFPSEAGKGKAGRESDDPNKLWHYGL